VEIHRVVAELGVEVVGLEETGQLLEGGGGEVVLGVLSREIYIYGLTEPFSA